MEIVKYVPLRPKPHVDGFLWAMYLMFLRAPGHKTAPGEPVDLGEIGAAVEKNWTRLIGPCSPATRGTNMEDK